MGQAMGVVKDGDGKRGETERKARSDICIANIPAKC